MFQAVTMFSGCYHVQAVIMFSGCYHILRLLPCSQTITMFSDCYHVLRLFELSKQERARSHQSASSSDSHDFSLGGKSQSKPVWDAAMFGPTGLLPGQSHTPTRIGRDLHELVAQHDQERQAGECCLWKLC